MSSNEHSRTTTRAISQTSQQSHVTIYAITALRVRISFLYFKFDHAWIFLTHRHHNKCAKYIYFELEFNINGNFTSEMHKKKLLHLC